MFNDFLNYAGDFEFYDFFNRMRGFEFNEGEYDALEIVAIIEDLIEELSAREDKECSEFFLDCIYFLGCLSTLSALGILDDMSKLHFSLIISYLLENKECKRILNLKF